MRTLLSCVARRISSMNNQASIPRSKRAWRPKFTLRCAVQFAFMLASFIAVTAEAVTICSGPGAGCTGTRRCQAAIVVPSLSATFQIDVSGPAHASVEWKGPQALLTWILSNFSGSDPVLGSINISLAESPRSTGVVLPKTGSCLPPPICEDCFPAVNTNEFHFRFEFSNLGTLLTAGPIVIESVIDQIPPIGAIYTLANGPVPLFFEDDPLKEPVAFLTTATVDFFEAQTGSCFLPDMGCIDTSSEACAALNGNYSGDGTSCESTIPTVSEWGLIIMALLLLTAGTILIRHLTMRRVTLAGG